MKKVFVYIKDKIKRIIKKPLVVVMKIAAHATKKISSLAFRILFWSQWCLGESPTYMDHNIDLYYLWKKSGDSEWAFRGNFSKMAIECFENPKVLELGCADGFNTKYFYRGNNETMEMVAVDISNEAIKEARKKHRASNIEYLEADFLYNMPGKNEDFTNVIWDASINFFTLEEIETILEGIAERLQTNNGILSGMAVVKESGKKWEHFNYYFENEEKLYDVLKKHFRDVMILPARWAAESGRTYFYACNGEIEIFSKKS